MKKSIGISISSFAGILFLIAIAFSCKKELTTPAGSNELKRAGISTPAGTVKDIDGNVYKTVTIGTQVWMAENLKTTRDNDGRLIPYWSAPDYLVGAYSWYNNDLSNKNTYGALYNWFAVGTGKLAPKGWHVPDFAEWNLLNTYLGANAAAKLQETGSVHWLSPNPAATNESGFAALPAGEGFSGGFSNMGTIADWWTGQASSGIEANHFFIGVQFGNWTLSPYHDNKQMSYSVRCLKDAVPTLSTLSISGISGSTALSRGNITINGGSAVTSRGVCWNTSHSPTIGNRHLRTNDGIGTGSFTSFVTGLRRRTTYYLRAYATNSTGTAYGNEIIFKTTLKP